MVGKDLGAEICTQVALAVDDGVLLSNFLFYTRRAVLLYFKHKHTAGVGAPTVTLRTFGACPRQ